MLKRRSKVNYGSRRCKSECIKAGRQRNKKQRYYCKNCKKYQQSIYNKNAYMPEINSRIILYSKESSGIRSISRLLKISTSTVIKRIKEIASKLEKPTIPRSSGFYLKVGKRNKKTLRRVTDTLLLSKAKKIYTDRLNLYEYLIPTELHTEVSTRLII